MAGKWFAFLSVVRSLRDRVASVTFLTQRRHVWRATLAVTAKPLALALLTLCLSVGMPPALSQTPSEAPLCLTQPPTQYQNGDVPEAVIPLEQAVRCWREAARRASQPEADNYWRNWAIASVNLGRLYAELGQQSRACAILAEALELSEESQKVCQNEDLPENWNTAQTHILNHADDVEAKSLRIFGDVLRAIGQLDASEIVLQRSLAIAGNPQLKAAVSLSLGNTYRAKGNLERDRQAPPNYDYVPWRYTSKCIPDEEDCVPVEAQQMYNDAKIHYEKVEGIVSTRLAGIQLPELGEIEQQLLEFRIKARLNRLSLCMELDEWEKSQSICNQSIASFFAEDFGLSKISQSARIYARINLAKSLAFSLQHHPNQAFSWQNVQDQLTDARNEARRLGDRHAESYAVGNLGGLYEYCSLESVCSLGQDSQQAQKLTEEALYLAQPSDAPDIAYQWQWQMGRLLNAQGDREGAIADNSEVQRKREEAIASYESAATSLELVRDNLLTVNSDTQFSFRDNVEPFYRQLLALLLPEEESNPEQIALKKAVYYIESLQVAELENFLRCDLTGYIGTGQNRQSSNDKQERLFEKVDKFLANYSLTGEPAAFIYPILLKDSSIKKRISIILKLPDQELRYYQPEQNEYDIESVLKEVQRVIKTPGDRISVEDQKPLEDLYKFLIQPVDECLKENRVKVLLFTLDSVLRDIPVLALHNGNEFLIDTEYIPILIPTVQLLKPTAPQLNDLNVLIAGISKNRNSYDPLILVEDQIKAVQGYITRNTVLYGDTNLYDGRFTKESLTIELRNRYYSVIHLITHGQYSSDPRQTTILTDDESEEKDEYSIDINEFEKLLRSAAQFSPVELVFLSACSGADGDNRAILGIAGVATKTKANGTIAPLWSTNQKYTHELVNEFYKLWIENREDWQHDSLSKAKALKLAQQNLKNNSGYQSPYHWASFIIVAGK